MILYNPAAKVAYVQQGLFGNAQWSTLHARPKSPCWTYATLTAAAWMGIAEAEQTAAQTAAEQRTASGPRCLRWTQLELEWKRRWAFLFFHSLPTSTLRSCFIRRARDGLRATSTPSQACLRGRGRAPNRLHQTIRKLQS